MLTLSQEPMGVWPLAWVGYVPLILCSSPKIKPFRLCAVAYIVSAVYWLGNLYWIGFVTISGWIAFCLYTGLLWPILVLCLRWCRQKRVPLFIAVPVLIVGIEQMQGLFLGGFYWHYLGHSQYSNTSLIQIADIFGAAGISFVVGMVNGLIAELLTADYKRRISKLLQPAEIIFVIVIILCAIGYGRRRIQESPRYVTAGPLIGAVQTNVPQSVKQSFAAEEEIFEELLERSKKCEEAGAELIVWPETMVQAILEPQVLKLLDKTHPYVLFDTIISEHAKGEAYVLVGAYGGSPRIDENFDIRIAQKYNSAFLYTPNGGQADEKYFKIHLVPFGETLPFKNIGVIHNLLIKMTPYDFDYTLDPGTNYTVFEIQPRDTNDLYKFSVMICYEDAVPVMARRFALDKEGEKQIDWLVNISNDGWFVRFKNDRVLPSTELVQHTAICAFRAIENRLAVLRGVNTGISCMIDTLGRVRDGYTAGNLPNRAFERKGVSGWFADTVPIDSRITIFSRYGQWLDLSCEILVLAIITAQLVERFFFKQNSNEKAVKAKKRVN